MKESNCNRVSLYIIKFYRKFFSPFIGGQCRFHPTCSAYAEEAIKRHGAIKGWILAVLRIMNCHPWSRRKWVDPVPEQFVWSLLFRYKCEECKKDKEKERAKNEQSAKSGDAS